MIGRIGGTPEQMAARKGAEDANAGKAEKPSEAWPVPLRKIYRESYQRAKGK